MDKKYFNNFIECTRKFVRWQKKLSNYFHWQNRNQTPIIKKKKKEKGIKHRPNC
jgi:hypothetical protein